ncbi:hypothetical protein M2266_000728 [Streptomyces sp. SPB162]|nr:hypothetical protein [Streptomyces sp. SPB162]
MPLSPMSTPRPYGSTPAGRSHRRRLRAAAAGGRRAVRRPPLLSGAGGRRTVTFVILAVVLSLTATVAGQVGAFTRTWAFLDFGAGVLALVCLTATVLWGLAATDRLLLHSSHRLLAQGVHRGMASGGLGFLALHIWVKVEQQETTAGAAAVPFTDGPQPLMIGLGTLAGYLFLTVAVTGAVRSAFASGARSRWWRALHMSAYPAWGAALLHGLKAGRPASGWVTVSYALCLVGVAGVLAIRLRSRQQRVAAGPPVAPAAYRVPAAAQPDRPPRSVAFAARRDEIRDNRPDRADGRVDSTAGWRL